MGSPIIFGSRKFNAENQGKSLAQAQPVRKQMRVTCDGSTDSLTTLGATCLVTFVVPVSPGCKLINLINLIGFADFVDAGVANYNVSDKIRLYINRSQFGNLDSNLSFPYLNNQSSVPYNFLLNVSATSEITIYLIIYGGDVLAATGITPGVGDTIVSQITMIYEPL